jgi:multidrug efflux system outer membrane protein
MSLATVPRPTRTHAAATLASAALACAALAACAVGPSTRPAPAPVPATLRPGSDVPRAARVLLDSLGAVRTAERTGQAPADGAPRSDSAARADGAQATLWRPAALPAEAARGAAWLDVLRDPQLVALVRTALANNRDVRQAQARVREFRALRGAARWALAPELSANGATSRNQVAFGPQVVGFDAVRATADLSWELDFWGRLRRGAEAAGYDYRAQEDDARATALSLVGDVAAAYLQLRELDEDVRLSEQTLVSRRSTLDLARRRFAQGLTSELDVRQFEAQVAEPAVRVADYARQRAQAEHRIALLLGSAPDTVARGLPLAATVRGVRVPDALPGALLERRPDVRRARRDLQAATARVGAAAGAELPAVVAGGQYGAQRPDFTRLLGTSGRVYTAQVGLAVPLFRGRLRDATRAARARAEQAGAAYEQTVLVALREASDALAGVRLQRDQLAAQATQADALQRALDLVERRYRGGLSGYLEVLDAQRGLFAAQLALVQVQRQYLTSVVDLYRALGGGWGDDGAGTPR